MDIHFIHTGVGEQTFFLFPDGTTMLLDCGFVAARKPDYIKAIPARPSDRLRGGEWVSRYLQRITSRREIDYVLVSHWHSDHTDGLPDIARDFRFRRWIDRSYPRLDRFAPDCDASSIRLAREFVPAAVSRGMRAEAFVVGALNQIVLQNDASRRYDFEIRNLAANGVVWDGKSGVVDYAADHLRAKGASWISENQMSNALVVRYGAFRYYTGGDVERSLLRADGSSVDLEAAVGRACGEVDVVKTNHHAYLPAMQAGFVREVRARAYLSSIWSPNQVNDRNLPVMASRELYPGPRTVHFGHLPQAKVEQYAGQPFMSVVSPWTGHAVVKVAEGGSSYEIFTLDAHDERMTVLGASGPIAAKGCRA